MQKSFACAALKENMGNVAAPNKNIAILNVDCGNVIIELYPDISPKAVERFKRLVLSLIHI